MTTPISLPLVLDRVASVDTLRGLTIALMVFVNDLGPAAPAFLHHIHPSDADGMTVADVVFPSFLFIVGVSIPLAFEAAGRAGIALRRQVGHILGRTAALLIMGVIEFNSGRSVPNRTWDLLAFVALILAWCSVPQAPGRSRLVWLGLKGLGIVGLLVALATFRRAPVATDILLYGHVDQWVWFRTGWWGILGLIAWAYLTVSILYLILGARREWLMGALACLMLLHLGTHDNELLHRFVTKSWMAPAQGVIAALQRGYNAVNGYVSLGEATGSLAAVTMAGCLLGSVLRRSETQVTTHRARLGWAATFALGLFLAGVLLDTFEGINKNAATPTWCCWSAALALLVWMFLYLIMDVLGWRGWSLVIRPAGANPLLAYFLHPITVWLVGLSGLSILDYTGSADPRVVVGGSAAMALFVCVATGLLARIGLRVRV